MKRKIAKAVCLLLVFTLAAANIGLSASAEKKTDGLIRVLLTQLKLTDRLDIALDGSYTVNNISFQRGMHLTVSSAGGSLVLYYEGMAMDCGQELVLVRHADEGENGLRLNGGAALYCGDLHLTIKEQTMNAILYCPVEEYLLGVVPYEMSDSFPVEALKVQAVAARTYALRKAQLSQEDYDVYDNTNDQVYKGYNAAYTNAEKAVKQTEGLCLYDGNQLAIAYYTASNGGQIETPANVWAQKDSGYIEMKDDPYDVENPESVVKTAKIAKSAEDGIIVNEQMTSFVLEKCREVLEQKGYITDGTEIRKISSVSTVGKNDTKVKSQLKMVLTVTAEKEPTEASLDTEEVSLFPDGTEKDEPEVKRQPEKIKTDVETEIIIPFFGTVETSLGLDINSSDNEILTVTETEDGFVLETRRYGHGVGMSQRGAQWMASQYGKNYEEILKFYYPGLTVKKAETKVTPQPAVAGKFLTTPGPAATATPRPTLMPVTEKATESQRIVKVTNIGENSSLNLRAEPNTGSSILRVLYYGQTLIAEDCGVEGWIKVKTDVIEGYVMEKFVSTENP